MNADPRDKTPQQDDRQVKESALLGSSYSYQDEKIQIGFMTSDQLAETEDD